MKRITSAQNPRLRSAIRLKSSRGRKTQRRIIIFGLREVRRAMESGVLPLELFLATESLNQDDLQFLVDSSQQSCQVYELPLELMQRLRYGDRPVEVVAVAQRPDMSLDDFQPVAGRPVVILESIEKPGNIGAVLRSIDGAGGGGLILADPCCDVLHPNCIRASMGTVFTVPIAIADSGAIPAWCDQHSIPLFVATDAADRRYCHANLGRQVAIAFGNEGNGLSPFWLDGDFIPLSIPMCGIADSLNVSVATAVMLYEAHRQRQRNSGA